MEEQLVAAGVSAAEATAVASFYTMYKRRPGATHHIGVCVNTMCGLLGGDAVYDALAQRLGVGHDQATEDGAFWLERIECQAACTHGPVMTANWEFLDDMDVPRALEVVEKLQRGEEVFSTRGPRIGTFEEIERSLAGFDDGLAQEGGKDDRMLAGLSVAKERGMTAPEGPAESPLKAAAQKSEG